MLLDVREWLERILIDASVRNIPHNLEEPQIVGKQKDG